MELSITKEALKDALGNMQGITGRKHTMPILSNVHLEATDAGLRLTGTDLEVGMAEDVACDVRKPGAVCVSSRKLYEIVGELPDGDISISVGENQRMKIKSGSANFTVAGLPADDYPVLPSTDEMSFHAIDPAELARSIRRTIFAAADNDSRYVLNGALFRFHGPNDEDQDGALTIVGTDGHRLAVTTMRVNAGFNKMDLIVPKSALKELLGLLKDYEDDLHAAFRKDHIAFRFETRRFITRLIEGNYPNYELVIPVNNDVAATIQTDPLHAALKRVSLLSCDRTNAVKFSLTTNKLTLHAENPDQGEATEDMDVDYGKDVLEIGFNAKYIQDALAGLDSGKVTMLFKDALGPCIMTPAEDLKADYKCIVMPMRA